MNALESARNYARVIKEGLMEGYRIGRLTQEIPAHKGGDILLYATENGEIILEGLLEISEEEIKHRLENKDFISQYKVAPRLSPELIEEIPLEELCSAYKY